MGEAVWLGVLSGAGAAIAVGPILVSIIHESLAHGFAAGFRISLGAAIADAVLLVPAFAASWMIAQVADASLYVCILGVTFLLYLGAEAAREAYRFWKNKPAESEHSPCDWTFWKGVLVNLLNPLTWTFWLTTGASMLLDTYQHAGWSGLVVYAIVFEVVLLGLEAGVAFLVTRTQSALSTRSKAILASVSSVAFLGLAGKLLFGLVG